MGTAAIDNREFVNNFKYGSIVYFSSRVKEECKRGKTRLRQINDVTLIVLEWLRKRWVDLTFISRQVDNHDEEKVRLRSA